MRHPQLSSILAEVSTLHRRLSNLVEIRNASGWGEGFVRRRRAMASGDGL
jgi:hypothetical protein